MSTWLNSLQKRMDKIDIFFGCKTTGSKVEDNAAVFFKKLSGKKFSTDKHLPHLCDS